MPKPVTQHRRPHPRRLRHTTALLGVAVLLGAAALPAAPAAAAPGDPPVDEAIPEDEIAAARARARELEAEIEALGAEASMVLEDYLEAQEDLATLDADLLAMRRRVTDLEAAVESAERAATDRAVSLYMGTGHPDPMGFLDVGNVQQLSARDRYASAVAEARQTVIDSLAARRVRLAEEETRVASLREEVAGRQRALRDQRDQVEAAMAQRQAALDEAEGALATLVEEARQARLAEEARRAREEAARRAAEEAQRRAEEEARRATSTTLATPGTGSTADPPGPPPEGIPPVHPNAQQAVDTALAQFGKPYEWGGNGPDTFDCSGLTSYAWRAAGVSIPRSSRMQKAGLPAVPIEHLAPGDLIFYGSPVHHVGLYIGDGEMVNAPYTGTSVRIDSIWRSDMNGAARPG